MTLGFISEFPNFYFGSMRSNGINSIKSKKSMKRIFLTKYCIFQTKLVFFILFILGKLAQKFRYKQVANILFSTRKIK